MSIECPFCSIHKYIIENNLAFVIYDKYPVTEGHALIIPKRHVSDYFDTTDAEKKAMLDLAEEIRTIQLKEFSPDGFNVGINCGQAAGQTIYHVHMHVIPRYDGDMKDPAGGVRGVIPEKQKY
ncbi:HIT family protein [Salisediminibacterium selenitireducens]|uniref:Histidine triad (HIT) protein n=1 Tax=Bacillus selenitireducens (strain ATCC 700615 / DSM 15326 / MLS10) TaxID=439292 RepID=D6XXW5_BACIE|nr:HIT family protein [Salisediminibacterium selenitireducens]ADI00158.1 histidine triad (HIT) protein [[Bacillus] selenitireducens MLS10]